MKKGLLLIGLILVTAVFAAACAGEQADPGPAPAENGNLTPPPEPTAADPAPAGRPYSDEGIREPAEDGAVWPTGRRFAADTAGEETAVWLEEAGLLAEADEDALSIEANGRTLTADLADNSSAQALRELLAEGPLTIEMSDYGDMEKVGSLGTDLPRNDRQIAAGPGDIILYQGNKLALYYGQNHWNFTRLGKLRDVEAQELRDLLGPGGVSVTLSLSR